MPGGRTTLAASAISFSESVRRRATAVGRRTVNVEPEPIWLCTVTSPPIIWQKRRQMTRPRPVPPYFREVEASAWVKAWNSLPSCSGVMPMPVSVTWKVIQSSLPSACRRTSSVTPPSSVNLEALERRLNRTCRTRVTSARMEPTSGGQSTVMRLRFFSTRGEMVARTSSTSTDTSKVSRYSSILPASIFERSRMSLMRASRCFPAAWIFLRSGIASSSPRSAASSWSISL